MGTRHGAWPYPLHAEVGWESTLHYIQRRASRQLASPYSVAMASGALAGMTTELALYPLDCLKTRRQCCRTAAAGGLRLYRGCSVALAGAAPASAVFFATYEHTKSWLDMKDPNGRQQPLGIVVASVVGELAASIVRGPVDLMKQRLQTGCRSNAMPGMSVFFASFQASALRDMCQSSLQYPLYEYFKHAASQWMTKTGEVDHLPVAAAACCGSAAGLISATITTPFDIVKTRLNLRRASCGTRSTGALILEEVVQIYRHRGAVGFFAGAGYRAAWMSLGGFVFLGSFELAKSRLSLQAGSR